MFVWDGSDRIKGDETSARLDVFRRRAIMHDHCTLYQMRDYVVAIGMALTGVEVEARSTAAPFITGGFTPDDGERATMCIVAEMNSRDIIHGNFRTIPPYTPTGLITTIFFDGEKAHPHSRGWILADEHDQRVQLTRGTGGSAVTRRLVSDRDGRLLGVYGGAAGGTGAALFTGAAGVA
jgi:hypothetical protein